MELLHYNSQYSSLFLLISCLLIFLHGYKKLMTTFSSYRKQGRQIPGPWDLPIIGSIHHFIGSQPPFRVLTNLSSKYGPFMCLKLGQEPFIIISSSHFAKEVTKHHDHAFCSRPQILAVGILSYNYSGVAFTPYGEDWRQRRKICVLELFTPKRVRSFSSIRWDECCRLITSIETSYKRKEVINLTQKIIFYASSTICKSVLGKQFKDHEIVAKLIRESAEVLGFSLFDLFACSRILHLLFSSKSRVLKVHKKIDNLLNEVINQRRNNLLKTQNKGKFEFGEEEKEQEEEQEEEEVLVDILLKIQENGNPGFPLTKDVIKGILFDIFFGGVEPASAIVVWAMTEMIRNPNAMSKAQREIRETLKRKNKTRIDENDIQELGYLKCVIKETLRLHSTAPLIPRECTEDCYVDGYYIPKKTKVIINAWGLGRDKDHWPNHNCFIPERFENNAIEFLGNQYEFIPFGSGRRMCPGGTFGLANVELPLSLLLYHFDWKLPDGLNPKDLDMSETMELSCSRKEDLILIPTLCYPFV